ncbi:MAG: hypothetical protein R3C53_16035 [Pirellulaceae bacterium]
MKAFAVLGPWRGGTSLVTAILHSLGVYVGDNFVDAATEYPTFEDTQLRDICVNCFDERPQEWRYLGTTEFRVNALRSWIIEANSRAAAAGYLACGGKHPVMCKLVPDIARAWRINGFLSPVFVSVIRSPEDVNRSWTRPERTGQGVWWPRPDRQQVVADLILSRDTALERFTRVEIDFKALMDEPEKTIRNFARLCGLPETRVSAATELVQPRP